MRSLCVPFPGEADTLFPTGKPRTVGQAHPRPLPQAAVVPSAQTLRITDFSFSDFELSDLETALCTIRMFTDLNLVQNFQMKHEVRHTRVYASMCMCVCV